MLTYSSWPALLQLRSSFCDLIAPGMPGYVFDLKFQVAALLFQEAGGPKIPMRYGRVDVSGPEECPEEGRLPGE